MAQTIVVERAWWSIDGYPITGWKQRKGLRRVRDKVQHEEHIPSDLFLSTKPHCCKCESSPTIIKLWLYWWIGLLINLSPNDPVTFTWQMFSLVLKYLRHDLSSNTIHSQTPSPHCQRSGCISIHYRWDHTLDSRGYGSIPVSYLIWMGLNFLFIINLIAGNITHSLNVLRIEKFHSSV